jgi:hypothetical protein
MGFRPATPPIPAPGTFPNLRNPDNVYHKPSGDQLAEMLKVVMMNQSTMDPVPVQYNSTILHVLEAYQDLRMQLIAKEEEIEVLKRSHTKDIKDFEELAAAWHQKEIDYKVEVKKLEVLLSKTEGGMESVAMARSRSVIHGVEKASDTIKRGIGTIKARNAARNSQDAGELSSRGLLFFADMTQMLILQILAHYRTVSDVGLQISMPLLELPISLLTQLQHDHPS